MKTTASKFLEQITKNIVLEDGKCELEIRSLKAGSNPQYDFFDSVDNATEYAMKLSDQGYNAYLGVNPRYGKAGKKDNIKTIACFHADIDYGEVGHKKPNHYKCREDALAGIGKSAIKPTLIVHSGGGLHLYWLLSTPANVDAYGIEKLEHVNKCLCKENHGDTGTHGLAMILRVAGTFNYKQPENPKRVDLVVDDGPEYDIETLIEWSENITIDTPKKIDAPKKISATGNNVPAHKVQNIVPGNDVGLGVNIQNFNISNNIKEMINNGSSSKYSSRSEADMAVVISLLNAAVPEYQIYEIFKLFPIGEKYREHPDGNHYLGHTIEKAKQLGHLTEEERESPLFINGVITKRGDKYFLQIVTFQELFTKTFHLKYVEDKSNAVIYRDDCYKNISDDRLNFLCQKKLHDYRRLFNEKMLKSFIHYLKGSEIITAEKSSHDRLRYLNMENGLYDLDNNELIDFTPDIYTDNRLPYGFDENAKCPRFLQFLDEVFAADKTKIEFVQESVGYIFHLGMPKPAMFFLVGGGSNGKSVFINILRNLVGDANSSNVNLSMIGQEHHILSLMGSMLNLASETPSSKLLGTDLIKAVVSGEHVTGRQIYQRAVTFTSYAKHFFAMNELPDIADNSYGMMRRIYVINFNRTFSDSEMDINLQEKLDNELSGIFNWAMDGYRRLKSNDFKFTVSQKMLADKEEYSISNDHVSQFIDECLCAPGEIFESFKDVFSLYQKFCIRTGYNSLKNRSFKTRLIEKGFDVKSSTKHSNAVYVSCNGSC